MLAATNFSQVEDVPTSVQRAAAVFLAPIVILAVAHYFGPFITSHLPSSLAGLEVWGPAMALFLGCALAATFNRGRIMFATLSLAGTYLAYQIQFRHGLGNSTARLVFDAVCAFVPFNLTLLSLAGERGIFTFYGARRAAVLALQCALILWVMRGGNPDALAWLQAPVLTGVAALDSPIPQAGMLLMLLGMIVAATCAVLRRSALDAGIAGALGAFAMASHMVLQPPHFAVYISAAAAMLAVAVLQHTFRLAFRDELTGLPSRRALNERMMALGHCYTIAMLDVDHFKQFNDTHGHALGDHVLRMVAAKLEQVGGGGRAYRFGGEEFTVVFPGRHVHEVWSQLEALRAEIATHGIVARHPLRDKEAAERRGSSGKGVSVTVSVGVAERNDRLTSPDDVLRAADHALYRAKDKGRNCLSM